MLTIVGQKYKVILLNLLIGEILRYLCYSQPLCNESIAMPTLLIKQYSSVKD
ncbi:hypothetical protein NIES4073_67720 [Kalymmatonema gypsitolerans NIES-4073]|nr:hypothetical protein NIES4073_67720 [Scytonema sp. NIES-4073]